MKILSYTHVVMNPCDLLCSVKQKWKKVEDIWSMTHEDGSNIKILWVHLTQRLGNATVRLDFYFHWLAIVRMRMSQTENASPPNDISFGELWPVCSHHMSMWDQ